MEVTAKNLPAAEHSLLRQKGMQGWFISCPQLCPVQRRNQRFHCLSTSRFLPGDGRKCVRGPHQIKCLTPSQPVLKYTSKNFFNCNCYTFVFTFTTPSWLDIMSYHKLCAMNIFELGKIRLPNLYPEVQEHLSNHILRRFYRLFTKKPILITPIQLPVSVTLPKFCVIAVVVTIGTLPGSPNKNLYIQKEYYYCYRNQSQIDISEGYWNRRRALLMSADRCSYFPVSPLQTLNKINKWVDWWYNLFISIDSAWVCVTYGDSASLVEGTWWQRQDQVGKQFDNSISTPQSLNTFSIITRITVLGG